MMMDEAASEMRRGPSNWSRMENEDVIGTGAEVVMRIGSLEDVG